ncbi:MAG: hypothetical protein ACOC5G_04425 [Acidobacteriota bacterium]
MPKKTFLTIMILFLMASPLLSADQFFQEGFSTRQIRLGLEAEFFDRMITWGENQSEASSMKSFLFLFKPGYELREGTSVSFVMGYSMSNFNDMIFRELPFSLELNTGNIDGLALGGEAVIGIMKFSDFTLSAKGQFIYYLGFQEQWEIPDLAVEGTAAGNPHWMWFTAGPKISFNVNDYLRPYLAAHYDILWGQFKMNEQIGDISKEQEMKIEAKSSLNFSIGALYEIIDKLDLKAEVSLLPLEEQIGLSIVLGAIYSF